MKQMQELTTFGESIRQVEGKLVHKKLKVYTEKSKQNTVYVRLHKIKEQEEYWILHDKKTS